MNIDLIIKLAKLANENPNENEANLAARKVCSLIKLGDYKFDNSKVVPNIRVTSNPSSVYNDFIKRYYTDEKRKHDNYSGSSWDYVFYDEIFPNLDTNSNKNKEKPKRILRCKTCKKDVETIFIGAPEVFECNDCSWSAWQRKRDSK